MCVCVCVCVCGHYSLFPDHVYLFMLVYDIKNLVCIDIFEKN